MHVTIWRCGVLIVYGVYLIVIVELLIYAFRCRFHVQAGAVTHTSIQRLHIEMLLSYVILLLFGGIAVVTVSPYVGYGSSLLAMATLPLFVLYRGIWVLRRRNRAVESRSDRSYLGFVVVIWLAMLIQYFGLRHDVPLSLHAWAVLFLVMSGITYVLYWDCKRRFVQFVYAVNPAGMYI